MNYPGMRCFVAAVAAIALATACAPSARNEGPDLVLSGLALIDVRTGEISYDQTIGVRDGIITSIQPDDEFEVPAATGAIQRDFDGKYVIPGLWDMHVHIRGGIELIDDNRAWLPQYLGYGVTSVRDAGGDIPEIVLNWKNEIEKRTFDGPRIFTSLRKVDGHPIFRPGSVGVVNLEDAGEAVSSLKEEGADFIKVNDGEYPDAIYLEVIRQAEAAGLNSAAHIPIGVTVEELAGAGLDSIEHDFYLLRFASADEEPIIEKFRSEESGQDFFQRYFGMFSAFAASIDEEKAVRSFRRMADAGIAVTPTLYLGQRWFSITPSTKLDSEARYFEMPEGIRETHLGFIEYMNMRSEGRVAADLNMSAQAARMVKLAAEHGVVILAGSDTGTTNTFVYPGDSLHHEMAALVGAGLSDLAALQAATLNAADWLGQGEVAGSLEVGKWADMVVLDRNPLVDIEHTRTIHAVVRDGEFYDKRSLDDLKTLPDELR